jgi:NAD(P)-dependent dehydrogenase (short-subunit alcohol dehydrogenase family)
MAFFDLSGKHALVTGATGPMQRAFAIALAEAGADVSLTTSTTEMAEEVQANSILNECWSIGCRGEAVTVPLADEAALETAVADIEVRIAPIDILVNASHVAPVGPFLDTSSDDGTALFNSNVATVLSPTRVVGRRMVERGSGRIVNLASILHDRGVPNTALYAASQGAIVAFTKALGIEWIRSGVTVNALGLGFTEELAGPQHDPELHAALERYIPLRRLANAEDLQGALVYLVSDEAGFVASELLVVDGAITAHG